MTGVLVAPPARAPVGFGLFSQVVFRPGSRWEGGADWESLACAPAGGIGEPQCAPESLRFGDGDWSTDHLGKLGLIDTDGALADRLAAYAPTGSGHPVAVSIDGAAPVVLGVDRVDKVPGRVRVSWSAGGALPVDLTSGQMVLWLGDPAAAVTVGLPKTFDAGPNGGHASAFTVVGSWKCSPVGYTPQQAQDRATEHLLTFEEARVERALWTGDLDNTPSLKGATDLLPAGTSLPIVPALAILEDHLAAHYGSTGLIHLTRGAALQAIAADAVHQTGGRLVTGLGTPVVAGSGYPGTGPAGEPAGGGFSWAYATPNLFAYRGDVFTSTSQPGDLFDRAQNDLYAVAERQYLLGFDPCGVAAVRLDLTTT